MTKVDNHHATASLTLERKTPISTELDVGWHSQPVW